MTSFLVASLGLTLLVIGGLFLSEASRLWIALGGAGLLALWLYGVCAGRPERRALRLLPGHALLLFAVGLAKNVPAFLLWLSAVALTFSLLAAKPQARFLWAILWPVLMGAVHQLGSAKFSGSAFWAWTAGLVLLALALTLREVRTILGKRGER